MLCAQWAAWPESWKPWQRLGFQVRGASLGITEPGRENPARYWGLASGEEARGSPSPPFLLPRARLGAPSAGSDFVWGRFLSGPQEFSTVK